MASAIHCATVQTKIKEETAVFVGTHMSLSFSVAADMGTYLGNVLDLGVVPLLEALKLECSKAPPAPAVMRALHHLSDGVRHTANVKLHRTNLREELVLLGKRVNASSYKAMCRSPFLIFVYIDESMDVTHLETMLVCFSFIDPVTFEFRVVVGELLDMADGTTGLHIFWAVTRSAGVAGVLLRIAGGSTDGASNVCAYPGRGHVQSYNARMAASGWRYGAWPIGSRSP